MDRPSASARLSALPWPRPDWWAQALTGGEKSARPAWADAAEQAVRAAAPPGGPLPMGSWAEAFAVPLRPFLAGVRDRLAGGARVCLPPGLADPERIAGTFTAALGPRLAGIAVRAMAAELDQARLGGQLAGDDGRERFADFLRWQSTPAGLSALFGRYPVLARLLGTASLQAADAGLELLTRFAADRPALVETLLGGVDPGPAVAAEPGLGDPHRRGRSVTMVTFGDGRKVIYKPRSMEAYVLFQEAVDWLNREVPALGLATAATLVRDEYGWQEYVTHRPLARRGDAHRFYRREGALLAVLYAMNAVDIHGENLIAAGDQPVLVDVEALLHPTLPAAHAVAPDPAAQALAASVYRTALLPFAAAGESGVADGSGMGGGEDVTGPDSTLDWDPPATDDMRLIRRAAPLAAMQNRPRIDGQIMEPSDHEADVLAGFRLGYNAIVAARPAFEGLLKANGGIEARVIVRLSSGYARLLDESTHPDLLRDARGRQQALDVLHEASAGQPLWSKLARHELADLWAGDIPLITSRPETRDIWTSTGQRLPGLLDQPGLSCALDKVAVMGEVDRRDQEWIISACLATRRPAGDHRSTQPAPDPVTAVAPPGRLLAAACGLADQIVARGMTAPEETGASRANWLGLQLVEGTRWMVLPMGAGLADGYLGVALFLAQLADLTGIDRYADMARRAVIAMPQLLNTLVGRPDLLAVVGCGAAEGLGGIGYGLARMATLLRDPELAELATMAVQLAATAAGLSASPWWSPGLAGCLAAATATAAELQSAAAASLAGACADRLTELVEQTGGRCVAEGDPVPPGFATGPAGVGWALSRFASSGAGPGYARAARSAVRAAAPVNGPGAGDELPGWCRGTAGVLVARTCLDDEATAGSPSAVRILTSRPVLSDLSLCHGELGIAEALTVLTAPGHGAVPPEWRHRAGLILGTIYRYTPCCGTPGGVSTPGLFNGLAGIGYGLLRLGYPDRVPSVLFLQPTPPSGREQRPV